MRTRSIRGALLPLGVLFVLVLCRAGLAGAQPSPAPYGEDRPPWLAMVARTDPADPARYARRRRRRSFQGPDFLPRRSSRAATIPYLLQRGDEIETEPNVIAVIRYPIGDVYIDAGTRVRIGSLDVLFGKVFARVRGLFSVENQNVVAGVEGTEFEFEVARNGATQITVLDGIVLSSSKRLPWKPLRVTRNQAFTVTDAGMQFRVGPASPAKLAQLTRWVRGVDATVAVLAPRDVQPPPSPQPPPPPEPQPVPPIQPPQQPPCHLRCLRRSRLHSRRSRRLRCRPSWCRFRSPRSSLAIAARRAGGSSGRRCKAAGARSTNRRPTHTGGAQR